MKIVIAGIGGVGGFFGGLLAKHYYENEQVKISFLARGEHLREIQTNGLKVINGNTEFIAKPALATDDPLKIGVADFIIVATKNYDLEDVMRQLRPCIDSETIILPLLNGVNGRERIKQLYPNNLVLDGCVYLVSRLKQPGIIENSGNIQTFYFGLDNVKNERLLKLESLLKEASIQATYSKSISTIIWEKFIFISPTATATSYFDLCIGELLTDENKVQQIKSLIEEVIQVAKAKGISIPEGIAELTLNKQKSLPFETTSSMHSDFKNKKTITELEAITGYVVREGKKNNVDIPVFEKMYERLKYP